MKPCVLAVALALTLAACGQTGQTGQDNSLQPDAESPWLAGKQAYDEICAGCHEEGIDDAPRTGDREAWDGRSWLWSAVLFEHAKEGYGNMPAKGGDAALDEATVTKAAEYMLTLTYPETHRD
jgi:cytochrome c5